MIALYCNNCKKYTPHTLCSLPDRYKQLCHICKNETVTMIYQR